MGEERVAKHWCRVFRSCTHYSYVVDGTFFFICFFLLEILSMIRGFDQSKVLERYSSSKFVGYHSFAELSNIISNTRNLGISETWRTRFTVLWKFRDLQYSTVRQKNDNTKILNLNSLPLEYFELVKSTNHR